MSSLTLQPVAALTGEIRLPGSKSISNRALLLAAMAEGNTHISNLLRSEDTQHMLTALRQLGITIDASDPDASEILVSGVAGPLVNDEQSQNLNLGLAGTALRPLAAALTLGRGHFTLDGSARMRERPLADLVDGLRQLGADIAYLGEDGYPPIEIHGTGLNGGTVRIQGNISSQFLTSILLAAPLARGPVRIEVAGEQVSKPYLDITLGMMRQFGVAASHENHQRFLVEPAAYVSPGRFLVEGDASAASYFLAAGAIAGNGVTVHGIGRDSTQGDIEFLQVLRSMGAVVSTQAESVTVKPGMLNGVDLDLNHIPDAAMTLATLALFAHGPTTIRNIYNWRVKETDRLDAMCRELRKLGAEVEEGRDYLVIKPPAQLQPTSIDTYGDHRMAMCFSLVALGGVPVTINDPDCVAKTFPNYFTEFARLAA
jgi:3-phosphoshikimate 1-carboxyvinyltransferase